mgnify:CR=1 FL=1
MASMEGTQVPTPVVRPILDGMKLTKPGDASLLPAIISWIRKHRPDLTPTCCLSSALCVQRLARAFACRSTNPTPKATAQTTAAAPSTTAAEPPLKAKEDGGTPKSNAGNNTPKKKKKPFRSIKKLDLSPKVVNALKGFVADLASCGSLIIQQVEYEQYRDAPHTVMIGQTPKPTTAVEAVDVTLKLLSGEIKKSQAPSVPTQTSSGGPSSKQKNSAAMDLFRNVLAKATQNQPNEDGSYSSTMDELKFKTFSLKVLECALERSVATVEVFYDYRFVYRVASRQQSLTLVPTKGTAAEQQLWAWKLACYIVWKRQEEFPEICSRKQRLMATVVSMVILATLPLLHRHTPDGEEEEPATITSTSNIEGSEGSKRDALSPESEDVNFSKKQKVTMDGDVSTGVPQENPFPDKKPESTMWRPQPECSYCLKQEGVFSRIVDAMRQALSFLAWATQSATNGSESGMEISRAELDAELNRVMMDLASFSDIPSLRYGKDKEISPFAWVEMLQNAIGLKDHAKITMKMAQASLLAILDKAFSSMQIGEEQRKGTRVEAVHYVPEMILAEGEVWQHMEHLCSTISSRRKKENENYLACVPFSNKVPTIGGDLATPMKGNVSDGGVSPVEPVGGQTAGLNPRLIVAGETYNRLISNNQAASPPVVTESMELNEWTIAVLSSLTSIHPTAGLRARLDAASTKFKEEAGGSQTWKDVIIPLLNRFVARMRQAVEGPNSTALPLSVDAEGEVRTSRRTQDTQFWASILQVYFHSLQCILHFEGERLNRSAVPKLVMSNSFHEALIACCYLCTVRAFQHTGKVQITRPESHQIYNIMSIAGCSSYSYLKVTESYLRALTNSAEKDGASKQLTETFGALPRILQKEVKTSEVYVLESLVWVRGNDQAMQDDSIVISIAELKQAEQWPPECLEPTLPEEQEILGEHTQSAKDPKSDHPEFLFVSFIMRKLLKIAYFRIQAICQVLKIPMDYPVASQIWLAFRYLLRNHVELLYGKLFLFLLKS